MTATPPVPSGEGATPVEWEPTWQGRRVTLRPVASSDLRFVYRISLDPSIAFRWRYRGALPTEAEFTQSLFSGVLVQFVVSNKRTGDPLGLVTAYNANQREGWVYLGAVADPQHFRTGRVLEGVGLLIDYLFTLWPFRKIYIESMEFNLDQFRHASAEVLVEEGRLKNHVFYADRYWDLLILALYRDHWSSFRKSTGSQSTDQALSLRTAGGPPQSLDLEAFWTVVNGEINFPSRGCVTIDADAKLEDLGFDSLAMLELVVLIDDLAGGVELDWNVPVVTVRDAYTWYCTAASCPRNLS
jgi:RimJ/RimL family protein N-acetyltransferase